MVTMDGTQTDTVPWEEGKESMSGGMIREVRRQELRTESGRDVRWCRDLEDEGLHCGPTLMHVANGSI